ncbi:MAG: HAD family hydrolase [Candidatus Poribacteria bacterium]|nr:HAD family hydrolase [Candidatus Poribacteria bacterium]
MSYKAIIFDLYGTLVGNFSRKAYDKTQEQMAKILGVPYQKFWQIKAETIKDRSLGNLSAEENIVEIGRRLNVRVDKTQIEKTLALNYEFTKNSLVPEPEVLEGLVQLKRSSLLLGLITNCNPTVPMLFPQSPLAQYIDMSVFSCEERIKKPSRRIYEIACERLNVKPEECVYVGDGSSEELTGAASVGMRPILKRADLTDVYDKHRPEVENWEGLVIDEISELCNIVPELA